MAVVFYKGVTLGPNDLNIATRDSLGNLIDPYYIRYAIYDNTTGVEVLMGSPAAVPVRVSTGNYYADYTLPGDANIGDWLIRWNIQETSLTPVVQSVQEFNVVANNVIVSFTGNYKTDALIHSLRILLRDNNPDRNYSVSGREKVKIRTKDKEFLVTLEELWDIIDNGRKNNL